MKLLLSSDFKDEIYYASDYIFPEAESTYDYSVYSGANTWTMAASAATSLAALYLYWVN